MVLVLCLGVLLMFFDFDYVIVAQLKGFESSRVDRSYRILHVTVPRTKFTFCLTINRYVHVPPLKKGDKIRVYLDVFCRGKSDKPQYKVVGIRHV